MHIVKYLRPIWRGCSMVLLLATLTCSTVWAQGAAPAASGGGDAAAGEALFKNNCAACHAASDEVVVGPGLKGVMTRVPNKDWVYKWVKNSSAVIASGDAYGNQIFNKYNKLQMQSFPDLQNADIDNILAYVESAATAAPTADQAKADGQGGATAAPAESGLSTQYFTIILVALLVVLALVLLVLIMIISLLTKFLSNRKDLSDEDRELLEQRTDIGKVLQSAVVKGAVLIIAVLLLGKIGLDSVMRIGIAQGYAPKQPISYSHKLHAGEYKINCAYCHTSVYKGKNASIPSANICMNCHSVIKNSSPEIKKLYTAIENNQPIEWIRVHNLPDHAYFNHSQHTNVGGLACQNCHGDIEKMEVVEQVAPLTMGWCIDCHRKTEVNTKGNAYYDKLVAIHASKEPMKVATIGGIECSKCHY
ncbi:cytochrome c3 family protein [Xanthocytophaga agilis]|uniref:Cytochrome c3 family protein n=1 Tax=Xanthocytophaga agilis TaxID=3048010 RepID=A0AAE3UCB1_9BACT|nr:cytochrome c3 family protein [Xanthocytophaga agilis]MDJ1500743.1 cytochrome c3 family protein [Xanthocytophaga agilis]